VRSWTGLAGVSERPGATWLGDGVNFSVFSAHADMIELCLFDEGGDEQRLPMQRHDSGFWTLMVPDLPPLSRYGYRGHGRWEPARGQYFNPAKLLIDPYARLLDGNLRIREEHYGHDRGAGDLHRPSDADSAPVTPKALVCHYPDDDGAPLPSGPRDVIYEAHVKGLTKLHRSLDEPQRGKLSGLKHGSVIAHLKSIGVDILELMPIHAFASEPRLTELGLRNYWGYNSIGFFAPHPDYLSRPTDLGEIRRTVERMHRADIAVVLDVVYNHTAEGDAWGPVLSFKGLDARSYYVLDGEDGAQFANHTGCGNTVNFASPVVQDMVLDSLRYWRRAFGIDGFRFDLAPTMMRLPPNGMSARFCERIANDFHLRDAMLLAEPWDVGPDGYSLGAFPSGWKEWNDRYRDDMRDFWLHGGSGDIAAGRMTGSKDIFPGRQAASVNFLACHDGFTLLDTLCFNARHNLANGENNADGHGHNLSHNFGYEGVEAGPEIAARRMDRLRAMLASLFVSAGPIMIGAGDEMLRTQNGNNNAYCQDNLLGWIDWATDHDALLEFVRALGRFRIAIRGIEPKVAWPDPDTRDVFRLTWDTGHCAAINGSAAPASVPPGHFSTHSALCSNARAGPCAETGFLPAKSVTLWWPA